MSVVSLEILIARAVGTYLYLEVITTARLHLMAAGSRSRYNRKTQTLYVCKYGVWLLALLSLFQCCVADSVGSTRLTGYRPVEEYRGIDDDGVFNILGE